MAIIYSYPTVQPTTDDLVLGTDVNGTGQPTKNFLISDIISLIQGGATGLGSTITANPSAADANGANQSATNFINLSGTGSVTFGSFATLGGITIQGTTGVGFTNITSTDFTGNLTGIVKLGSSIAGTANGAEGNNVLGVTQPAGTSNRTLATTAFVASRVDPSVLQYRGDATGPFDLNLVTDDLQVSGTTSEIEVTAVAVNAGNIGNIVLGFPAAGVTLPDGSLATTQLAADDSTKVATTAFVRNYDDLQDLDFSGTTGTGAVLLNNQTLAISGTANQVVTAAAGQTLTISLPATVIRNLQGNVTGILKDGSSIETTVTGVTQTAGNDSTRLATTKYVDNASGAKTLDYAGDATGPFALNLSTDDLEFNGDSNITVTAAVVNAGNKGIVTIDLDDAVTITGKMQAGTLSDGTFSGSTGTYTGGVSITSALFVGPLTGNASTATALADPGTIQLLSGSGLTEGVASGASTYTDGGNLSITTSLANTTVTSKTLLNLPSFTTSSIAATDTINQALAKLQGQINAAGGGGALSYEGAWRASVTAVSNGAVAGNVNLVIATADANLVKGTVVEGAGITGTVRINSITGTAVTLDTAITIATGITLTMSPPGGAITGATAGTAASLTTPANKLSGRFYICDTVGKAEPNAAVPWAAATTPNEWAVGDWVVYISNGSQPDEWQKLDQSNELFGSGAANKIAKWTASNTLGTGLIEDDGTTVTIGANGNLTVLGDTILGDDATADTITLKGVTTLEAYAVIEKGISLGNATNFGTSGFVLTSAGGSGANAPTWTAIPATGVTSVALTETGNALTITGSPITSSGTLNIAGAGVAGSDQYINGFLNLVDFPDLDNYVDWKLQGDSGTNQSIIKQTIVDFAGGTKISTAVTTNATQKTLTINHAAQGNTGATDTQTLTYGGTFAAISAVPVDTTGHLTGQTVKTFTMPTNPDFVSSPNGSTVGTHGLVPAPVAGSGSATYFLNGTGAFSVPTDLKGIETINTTSPIGGGGSSSTVTITHDSVFGTSGSGTTGIFDSVTVDAKGHVIAGTNPGGSGGGIFSGDQAIVTANPVLAFTLNRATTGTLMFDVWLTSETSTATSVAKKYTVAHSNNATPVYNKIIDTGLDGSNDFLVTFLNAGSGLSVTCNIQAVGVAQNIGYTVQVGHDSTNALTFTAAS